MFEPRFTNGGAMFPRDKKSENAPDFGGDFTLDGEVIQHIIGKIKANEQVKLEISGWKRTDRNGKTFLTLKIKKPYVRDAFGGGKPDPFASGPSAGPSYAQAKGAPQKQASPPFFDDAPKSDAPWE